MSRRFEHRSLVLLGLLLYGGCKSANQPGQTSPAQVYAIAHVSTVLVVPPARRAQVLAMRDAIEARGGVVAADGAAVAYPPEPASLWLLEQGGETMLVGGDGSFSVTRSSNEDAVVLSHPASAKLATRLPLANLSTDAQQPTRLLFHFPFSGSCGMSLTADGDCHAQDAKGDEGGDRATQGGGDVGTELDAHGSVPRREGNSECLDYDGPIGGASKGRDATPYVSYLGSTCERFVKLAICVNEHPLSDVQLLGTYAPARLLELFLPGRRLAPDPVMPLDGSSFTGGAIECRDAHKGRWCQQLRPGDIAVGLGDGRVIRPGAKETLAVGRGQEVRIVVHNNGARGNTWVDMSGDLGHRLSSLRPGGADWHPSFAKKTSSGSWELLHYRPTPRFGAYVLADYSVDVEMIYFVPADAEVGQFQEYVFRADHNALTLRLEVEDAPPDGPMPDAPVELDATPDAPVVLDQGPDAAPDAGGHSTPETAMQYQFGQILTYADLKDQMRWFRVDVTNPGSASLDLTVSSGSVRFFWSGTLSAAQAAPAGVGALYHDWQTVQAGWLGSWGGTIYFRFGTDQGPGSYTFKIYQ